MWIGGLAVLLTIAGTVGAFVLTTRETALRLEWRIQQTERILNELQAAKDLQRLALEVRATQNALRGLEMQMDRLRKR